MRTLAATLTILALAASPALAVTHKATGFGVEPPFPFSARAIDYPGADATFGILSMTRPTPPAGDPYLCLVGFSAGGPFKAGLHQEEINAIFAADSYRETTIANAAAHLETSSSTTFDERGMTGLELIGTPKGRQGASEVRLFISSFASPKGSVWMSCATTADQIDAATETFRMLRHTIIVPTGTQ